MVRPPIAFHHALKILNVTAKGGVTVLLSTISSCYLAVVVEKTAHRVQYHYFPHWYKDVDFALGLDLHQNHNNGQNGKIDNNSEKTSHSREEMFITNHNTMNNVDDWIGNSEKSYDWNGEEEFSRHDTFETQQFHSTIRPVATITHDKSSMQHTTEKTTLESPPSRMSCLFQSFSNESMSSILQNCAMTS